MKGSIKIGQILGIPIRLHWSWFLVFLMVSWSLASGYFVVKSPGLSTNVRWILSISTSLLFFSSVLAHELGHAVLALRKNVPVESISLFILGGVAQISREPRTPEAELKIAIAGPATSLGLAATFGIAGFLTGNIPGLSEGMRWLSEVNLVLAVFNMIPGFPLDGGRVLRAILWWYNSNYDKSTRIASFSGQLVAIGFFGYGIYSLFGGNAFNGVWLVFLGWFLQNAASSYGSQTQLERALDGITVENLMSTDIERISGNTSLRQIFENQFLSSGYRYYVVSEDGRLRGLFSLQDLGAIPRTDWHITTAEQVMVPVKERVRIEPETGLLSALELMKVEDLEMLPVFTNDDVTGVLTSEHIHRYMKLKALKDG